MCTAVQAWASAGLRVALWAFKVAASWLVFAGLFSRHRCLPSQSQAGPWKNSKMSSFHSSPLSAAVTEVLQQPSKARQPRYNSRASSVSLCDSHERCLCVCARERGCVYMFILGSYKGLRRRPGRPPIAGSGGAQNVSSVVAEDGDRTKCQELRAPCTLRPGMRETAAAVVLIRIFGQTITDSHILDAV